MFLPKVFTTLQNYSFSKFQADVVAGTIVGIVALPLAIAFAIASGVSPERGLYTAIIGGLIVSTFGGSRVQIAGPTGAFVVIVFDIVTRFGLDGLFVATILGGVLLIIMGFAGLGSVIKFVPYPVVIGFTSGIAVIIFSSQIKDFFGLTLGSIPTSFLAKWLLFIQHAHTLNLYTLAVSLVSLLIILFSKKIFPKLPGPLFALIFSTVIVYIFQWPVETIGSRFGEIPHGFPHAAIPQISVEKIKSLMSPALTIAILGAIESLLSAVVADGMIGGKHRSNMELVAQGAANILSPIFGGIPVTGAIARTATNINSGGRTPIAGIIHSIVLLFIMLFLGKMVIYIPLATLAATLIFVAYHMSEWKSFLMILKSPRGDVIILLVTFILTVLIDLTVAIQVGVFLSILLFMRKIATISNVEVINKEFDESEDKNDPAAINKKSVPQGVEVYEVNGPFFFGASYKFMEAMQNEGKVPRIRIIRMRNVPLIDATGLHAIKEQHKNSVKRGIPFIISGINDEPYEALKKSGLLEIIGKNNVFKNIDQALERANEILESSRTSSQKTG